MIESHLVPCVQTPPAQRNVATFGAPDVVAYHKGFFADAVKSFDCPPLISLWLDVDLAASARDVMTIFPRVDSRGAVFSHECGRREFHQWHPAGARPVFGRAADSQYRKAGAAAEGIHRAGQTRAFWRGAGIAVMPQDRFFALQASY